MLSINRMIFFAMSFLYNVFKFTTMAMLVSVVSGCMVVIMFISWFIWAAREVHFFRKAAEHVVEVVVSVS